MSSFPTFQFPRNLYKRPIDVISVGYSKYEMILRVPKWLREGGQHDLPISSLVVSAGGCATNVACFISRLGGKASLICRLSDGKFCTEIWKELKRSKVITKNIHKIPNRDGNLLIILTNPKGDWEVLSNDDAFLELDRSDLILDSELKKTKIIHIDGFAYRNKQQHQLMMQLINNAHKAGCLVSIDASVPMAKEHPDWALKLFKQCDIVFANKYEGLAITKTTNIRSAIKVFQSIGLKIAVIKLGSQGSMIISPNKKQKINSYKVKVVDTIGAGDAFIGTFLLTLCQNGSLREASLRGSAAGALACTGPGSLVNHFSNSDIDALLKTNKYIND
jgi:sugar/nucleoside kinase (ribokinase family)